MTAADDGVPQASDPEDLRFVGSTTERHPVPQASLLDTLRVGLRLLIPLVGRGLIARRPPVVALAERLDLDRRAVRQLQRLQDRYGPGPLRLRLPGRTLAVVLDADHVHRVLQASPEIFSAANLEKRRALGHFQPAGVLISEGRERADRRRFNEVALDTPSPIHAQAEEVVAKVREEAAAIRTTAERDQQLDWENFVTGWYRAVRRVVFGDQARDDHQLTDMLGRLRANANWAYLRPKDRALRRAFLTKIQRYLDQAESGSLAERVAEIPASPTTQAPQQIPQWLFAFDPAGIATIRALALIAGHPSHARQIRHDLGGRDLARPQELSMLRACVLESLRLWPTTPGLLRDTETETTWGSGVLPSGAGVVIFAPLFHRDDRRLPEADRFAPQLWSRPRTTEDWPLVPFSEGPVVCPGQHLVLLMTTTMLAALLEHHDVRLTPPDRLGSTRRLPSVLNPFDLRFRLTSMPAPS